MKFSLTLLFLTFSFQLLFSQTTCQKRLLPESTILTRGQNGATVSTGILQSDLLRFQDNLDLFTINRMTLDKTGLTLVNGGNWTSARLFNGGGSSGQLDLFAGGGTGVNVRLGPDPYDATQGRLYIFDGGANKIDLRSFDGAAIVSINGQNGSDNGFLSFPSGRPNVGYIAVEDVNGQIQAGLIVSSTGTGEVFGDTKNFRMPPSRTGR